MANGIFNAEQYLELYPALVEAGITVDTAWDHYATYGAGELRAPNAELDGKVYAASVLNYANANEDVAEYFGIATPATSLTQQQNADVMLQYVLYGSGEERDAKIIDAPVIVDDSELVAAINDYQDAKKAEQDAIKEAAKELKLEEATKESVKAAVDAAATKVQDDGGILDFGKNLTPAVRDQLLKAKEDTLKAELAQQENLQGKALSAAKARANADVREESADKAQKKAALDLDATDASFKVVATEKSVTLGTLTKSVVANGEVTNYAEQTFEDANSVKVKLVIKDGKAVFVKDNGDKIEKGSVEATVVQQIEKLDGYSDYIKTFSADAKAADSLASAQKNAKTAEDKYTDAAADADVDPTSFTAYKNAYEDLQVFNELAKDYKDAAAQLAKVNAAGKDVDAAAKVLEDMGYELVVDEFATENDDLFIYTQLADDEDEVAYFDFGAEGDDLFFFGTQFNFVELKASDDIAKGGFGDKSAFEIFAQQDGNDVVLYVETNEVGGTATGAADLDQITLVGVDLADLQWEGGFLTVA